MKDRYEKLPNEIKKCWKLNKLLSFGYFLPILTRDKSDYEIYRIITEFYDETEEIATELALDISYDIYSLTMNYYTLLSEYSVYINKNKVELFENKMLEIRKKSNEVLQKYESEYEILTKKFSVKL